ncbi:prolipoprotein diacylglyceryl transferase [Mycobacterium sp. 23]|uniref:prolipoprotein diacylglyceryl transferase n=1 Tax=Mycobacterium sp. 23 TaxID=3400424 RepID=UPI003AADEE42
MSQTYLAYIPSPPRGVWHLGPLPIRAYAFFIITGILLALLIADRRWVARGGQRGVVYDIALWMVPFGLIGGRLYHLATDWQTYWGPGGAGTAAALRIWDGGLGIWGAVALGAVGAWIGCRRRDIPLPAFLDAVAPGVVLAQAIGRLGNYFNQELYGRETTVPWGLEIFYRRDPAGYVDVHSLDGVSTGQVALVVQPTFLYELVWNLLVFGLLLLLDRRLTLGHARLFASYVALYCVGRFAVELLRDDTATHIAGIRINTFTSTFVFIAAVVYIILAPKGREDPALLRGRMPDEADEALEPEPAESEAELASVAATSAAGTAALGGGEAAGGEEPTAGVDEPAAADASEPEPAGTAAAESDEESEPEVTEAQAAVAEETVEGDAGESDQAEILEEAEAEEAGEPAAAAGEAGDAEAAEEDVADAEEAEEAEAAAGEPEAEESAPAEAADSEAAESEPVDEASPEAAVSGGHPLLGGGPTVPEETDEAEEAVVEAEPEVAEAEVDEAEPAAEEAEQAAEEAEQADEAEPAAEEAEQADEAEEAVVEAEPEVAKADVDEAEPAVEAAEQADEAEPAVDEADLVANEADEPEAQKPEEVDEPTAEEEDAEPESGETEIAEAGADESAAVESESTGDDEPAPPAPDTPTEESAGTARQRWRLRLRRQR